MIVKARPLAINITYFDIAFTTLVEVAVSQSIKCPPPSTVVDSQSAGNARKIGRPLALPCRTKMIFVGDGTYLLLTLDSTDRKVRGR